MQQWPEHRKKKNQFHSNLKEGKYSKYHPIVLISYTDKIVLKILQARCQQYINQELSDVQAAFRKGRENQRINPQYPLDHRKAREIQKNICFIDYIKTFDFVGHNKLWKILKEMRLPEHLPPEKSV